MKTPDYYAIDCEVYPNYTLLAARKLGGKRVQVWEIPSEGSMLCNKESLKDFLTENITFGFNSRAYDQMIILYMLQGKMASEIYGLSKYIIESDEKPWLLAKTLNLKWPDLTYRHIDLIQVAHSTPVSLKLYGARLQSELIQDLPYSPVKPLTDEQKAEVKAYCGNDLALTENLYKALLPQLNLRASIGRQYRINLMSEGDAGIAEKIIRKLLRFTGNVEHKPNTSVPVRYRAPHVIPEYDYLQMYEGDYYLTPGGKIQKKELPPLEICGSSYTIGTGGLHSNEKNRSLFSDSDYHIYDIDVASYYPSLIINHYESGLPDGFISVYKDLVRQRLEAKGAGNKDKSELLKIVINGTFGKLLSPYSVMYSPENFLLVVLTGQLTLLDLICRLELDGVQVVSANTDGVMVKYPAGRIIDRDKTIGNWCRTHNLDVQITQYRSVHSRSVSDYFAVKPDGKVKVKGKLSPAGVHKNPDGDIVAQSVIREVVDQVPLETTVRECTDLTKFLFTTKIAGGGYFVRPHKGEIVKTRVGRVGRWVWTTSPEAGRFIRESGNQVPKSSGSMAAMDLPGMTIENAQIDFDRYVTEAKRLKHDLGLGERAVSLFD